MVGCDEVGENWKREKTLSKLLRTIGELKCKWSILVGTINLNLILSSVNEKINLINLDNYSKELYFFPSFFFFQKNISVVEDAWHILHLPAVHNTSLTLTFSYKLCNKQCLYFFPVDDIIWECDHWLESRYIKPHIDQTK